MGGQHHAPAALPLGKTRYPLHTWMGGHRCWSRHVQKIVHPLGFEPKNVQSVASRYTNYTILATPKCVYKLVKLIQ